MTIAIPDRAAQSRVFARSARECHPDARLVVLALEHDGPVPKFEDLCDLVIPAERRFELVFTVCEGDDYPDFEMRIWARMGTALEIGRIDLYELPGIAAGTAP